MTLHRWATKGLLANSGTRVRLETAFVGGTRVTSKEALVRFFVRKDDVLEVHPEPFVESRFTWRANNAKQVLRDSGMLD